MNGRIYDSALGRFLSADPLNQDIFNTQTYNAYSYVLNNPLSFTDPTGMEAVIPSVTLEPFVVTGTRPDWRTVQPWFTSGTPFGALLSPLNSTYINQSFQPVWRALPSDQYLGQVRMNMSFYSYGVLKGAFCDLPVGAWQLAGMIFDLNTVEGRTEASIFVGQYTTDPGFRNQVNQAIKESIKESVSSQENIMMNGGRLAGGIAGTKGLGEAITAIKAASRVRAASGMSETASATLGEGTDSISAMRRLKYEPASYHGPKGNTVKSSAPTNAQEALDSSMRVNLNSPRRISVDPKTGEIAVFDQTSVGVYHGHVRSWAQLTQEMKNVLIEQNLFTRRGVLITNP